MTLRGRALEQIAAAYVLGSLSLPARRRFEAQLQRDAAARRICQQWEQRLAGLAQDLPAVRPPEHSWVRLQARLQEGAPLRAPASRQRWIWITALLVAAVTALIWSRLPR